jgi:hypothetical protein
MTLSIHLTQNWPLERVEKYGRDITQAIKKLVARFPDMMTVNSVAEDIISGKNQLWLILDGEDFKSFVLSEIKVDLETGVKHVRLTELAGEGGVDVVPLIADIEEWAKSIGAKQIRPIGRIGWRKALAKQGYSTDLCMYHKELA